MLTLSAYNQGKKSLEAKNQNEADENSSGSQTLKIF
jgi:hypothetical protein